MRSDDKLSTDIVVRVLLGLAGFIAFAVIARVLNRPGLALALLGLYVVVRLGVARWRRPRG